MIVGYEEQMVIFMKNEQASQRNLSGGMRGGRRGLVTIGLDN